MEKTLGRTNDYMCRKVRASRTHNSLDSIQYKRLLQQEGRILHLSWSHLRESGTRQPSRLPEIEFGSSPVVKATTQNRPVTVDVLRGDL